PDARDCALARGQRLERSVLGDALACQFREFSALLWFRVGLGHGSRAVYALSRFGIAARRAGARVERRAVGGPAHAALAAYFVQSVAYHPRPHRVGSEGGAVHGGAARRSVAALAQRRRAGFFAAGRRATFCKALPRVAAAALHRSPRGRAAESGGNTRRVGAEFDIAALDRERRGARHGGPSGDGEGERHGAARQLGPFAWGPQLEGA